jgi:aryl-alcohol dehydrogenase-like predicted oxidoreductase
MRETSTIISLLGIITCLSLWLFSHFYLSMATVRSSYSSLTGQVSHRHNGHTQVMTVFFVFLFALSLKTTNAVVGAAFVVQSPTARRLGHHWCRRRSSSCSFTTVLFSSPSSLTPDEEDEIAKLVGKRNQIKRKKSETPDPRQAEIVLDFEGGEKFAAAEGVEFEEEATRAQQLVDLDLDKLPEFKIERPRRRAKQDDDGSSSNDDDDSTKSSQKKPEAASPIVDFKADYDDENDLLHIPNRIGITTTSWGDTSKNFVPSGKLTKSMIKSGKFVPGDLQTAYTKLLERGVTFIETSSTYGAVSRGNNLSALDILKRCLEEQTGELPESILCNSLGSSAWTKLLPSRMTQTLYDAVERLGTASVELFTIPKSRLYPTSAICSALATAIESGCCNNVGVSGVTRASTLRKIIDKLQDRDVTLVSNAFEYSLTNTRHEDMINVCKELNVIPIILNPLDGGLASGVYTATNPSGGQAGGGSSMSSSSSGSSGNMKFTFAQLEKLQPLHSVQETVAERVRTRVIREMQSLQDRVKGGKKAYGPPPIINTDITTTQIAINYVIAKGGVPLVEVNSPRQADEVLGSLGWTLNDDEVDMLDAAAALCQLSRK